MLIANIFLLLYIHFFLLVCQFISSGVSLVLDLTKRIGDPETRPQNFFLSKSIPFYKVDVPFDSLLRSVDALIQTNNGSNGFLIFNSEVGVNRGVNTILGSTIIRYAFLQYPEQEALISEKFEYRVPSAVSVIGTETQIRQFLNKQADQVKNRTEWIFVLNEFLSGPPPKFDTLNFPHFRAYLPLNSCCSLMSSNTNTPSGSSSTTCSPSLCRDSPTQIFLRRLAYLISQTFQQLDQSSAKVYKLGCNEQDRATGDKDFAQRLSKALNGEQGETWLLAKDGRISFNLPIMLDDYVKGIGKPVGEFKIEKGLNLNSKFVFRPRKRYFRIGIVEVCWG